MDDRTDVTTDPALAGVSDMPGFTPLSPLERQALILAVRCVMLEIRQAVAQRLQRGELLASVEGDLGPLVTERLRLVHQVLFRLDPAQAFTAAASIAWCMCFEALTGDLAGVKQLLAVAQQTQPPADPASERP